MDRTRLLKYLPLVVALLVSASIAFARVGAPMFDLENFIVGGWGHPDNLGNHWLLVWVSEQVLSGGSLLHNDRYYVPFGDAPWLAGNGSEGFLFLPFYLLFGWPVGSNVMVFCVLTGIGLAGYALARASGGGAWPSLVGAAVCASTPYMIRELSAGRFSQADTLWLVLSVAAYIQLLRRPGTREAVLCGVLVAVTSVLYWYYGFFFLLAAVALTAVYPLGGKPLPFRYIAIAVACSILLAGPVLWIYLHNWESIPGTLEEGFPSSEAVQDSVSPQWPWLFRLGKQSGVVSAWPTLGLATTGLVAGLARKDLPKWLIAGAGLLIALFWLLALGANGPLFEHVYGITGALRRFWWPSRHMMMVHVGMAILASLGAGVLLGKLGAWPKGIVSVLLAVSVPISMRLQGNAPFSVHSSEVDLPPKAYVELADLPGNVILQPPLSPKAAYSQVPLLFQLYHGKRLFSGHALWVDRVRPPRWDKLVRENGFLSSMVSFEEGLSEGVFQFEPKDLGALRNLGVDLFVLDDELFSRHMGKVVIGYRNLCNQLFGRPVLEVDGVMVWDLQNWKGKEAASLPGWTWPDFLPQGDGSRPLPGPRYDSRVYIEPVGHRK
jgi:hypothetical protein